MNEFGRGSFGERMIMTCQVCMNSHHDGQKEVFVQDPQSGAYKKAICPLCICLDCVQQHDDPIRKQIRPLMMGQTLQSEYNLDLAEHKPGEAPTRRMLNIKAPGPLNVHEAIKKMGDVLGLQSPEAPPQHRLPQAAGCG